MCAYCHLMESFIPGETDAALSYLEAVSPSPSVFMEHLLLRVEAMVAARDVHGASKLVVCDH